MLRFSSENLYRVMRDFYTLTKIRIVLFDSDFRELLSYPAERRGFCASLRVDPAEDTKCRVSDRKGCEECARSHELTIYRCHAGLTEAVVPIVDQSGVIGYIMFGQIIPEDGEKKTRHQLMRCYPELSHDISQIAVKPEIELTAAATILQALTAYVMNNGWVVPGKSEFIRQLDQYIKDNLNRSITCEDLCREFHLTRSRMYALSTTYLGCGLAEYVRMRRILYAQQMLEETDIPIGDIAATLGFSDYNHFSRVFKQICGISARAYRKQKTIKGVQAV